MDAKIFFGSKEIAKNEWIEIKNPYRNEVVSRYPKCDANDAFEALKIAKEAFKKSRKTLLSQRVKWLEDVDRAEYNAPCVLVYFCI